MAKKSVTRGSRKPKRAPKLVEVRGHQLTPAMYVDFETAINARAQTNKEHSYDYVEYLALCDFLHEYRPSIKAKSQLKDIFDVSTRVGIAVASMADYPFYTSDGSVRPAACELLNKLSLELYYASAKLAVIASNVRAEGTTKLQHWLTMDEQLAKIGKVPEVAHG